MVCFIYRHVLLSIMNVLLKNSMVSDTVASEARCPISITVRKRGCVLCLQKCLTLKHIRLGGWRTGASGLSNGRFWLFRD